MIGISRRLVAGSLAALLSGAVAIAPALAEDLLAGLSPLGASSLKANNVQGNLFNTTDTSLNATNTGNSVSASKGGQVVTGLIQNNNIANNNGLTAVLMNTGNNVNFNNSMVVNVIVPH